ncbi:RNA 2',3'-cyclic phosphodiesterase [Bacillus alveayuensis]|jgi:RNA 2',3'-cyclic 3'-phosphodiesterase|uniref:RNA 2',3'-cyclic phosphodiesterase n=1 Tax=Aeribacillus alveayuensis TaxID=279215 RepID=UPI0005D0FFD6|nr:RNA 2',3'-cyclic phosphodiesterase [Bacillus alveayuensis]
MRKKHYFIAVPIPLEIRERLAALQSQLKESLSFRNWVHQQDYHITLAFLGEASFIQLEQVKQAMEQIAKSHRSFMLTLDKIGTFGNRLAPRILWQGVKEEPKLYELRDDVYRACIDIGFSLDKRPFAPHITLARKWQGEHEFDVTKVNNIFENKDKNEKFIVERIVLFQTHLDRTPKYEPLFVFPLLL